MKHFFLLLLLAFVLRGSGATYYVSSVSGNDANSGATTLLAWQSLSKVNTVLLNPGDSILFKRGETWRGQLVPKSGSTGNVIYYGAYGTGANPVVLGSQNYSAPADWIDQGGNVWKCNAIFSTDIGNIIFDNDVSVGYKKWDQLSLQIQDDYWYNLTTGEVSVYSVGNPASIHSEIELALRNHIVDQQNTSYVTYENLSLKYGAAHGFGGGNTSNITISSCEMSFIGGGDLNMDGIIRFGNAVEFWGNSVDNKVEKCKIWEIYDTGLSNQNHTNTVTQQNIYYHNNIIWNCGLASFEYWSKPAGSVTANIRFENNTCLYAGGGWGSQRPDYYGIHVLLSENTAQTDSIYIRNNIFYTAQRAPYVVADNMNGFSKLAMDYNLIYQPNSSDSLFVAFPSFTTFLYSDLPAYVSALGKDVHSLIGDPLFVNIGGEDFHLSGSSPAINSGVNVEVVSDIDGNVRPLSGGYDIGAYEYTGAVGVSNSDNTVKMLLFPNPTQGQLQIAVFNSGDKDYCVTIYNESGQKVRSVKNYQSMDSIDLREVSKGIFWVELSQNEKVLSVEKIIVE